MKLTANFYITVQFIKYAKSMSSALAFPKFCSICRCS